MSGVIIGYAMEELEPKGRDLHFFQHTTYIVEDTKLLHNKHKFYNWFIKLNCCLYT